MAKAAFSRRQFLGWSTAIAAGGLHQLRADDTPLIDRILAGPEPRQTSGDSVSEPIWDKRLTITVGQDRGDLMGKSHQAIQAAVDYVSRLGGGTVKILPGEYVLRGSVHLRSNVRLIGSGPETILTKAASVTTKLSKDSDWYDQEVTLTDPSGFEVGDSVCLQTKNPHNGGQEVLKRTLIARSGNRFKLDKALRQNYWTMGDSTCSTLFPLVTGEEIQNLVIEDLALDGNRANNELLDGNYGGCVFFQDVNQVQMRRLIARNNNGDGLSWQISHDVMVEDCHSHGHTWLAMHPGSGSQRPIIRKNRMENCQIGLFFCWGVKNGLAEENTIMDIKGQGISIGHRDTDNIVRRNVVRNSGQTGVLFRPERGPGFCGHRNLIENNLIEDSGGDDGIAIDVQGGTELVTIKNNIIRENRASAKRVGVRLGKDTKQIVVADNTYSGLMKDFIQA